MPNPTDAAGSRGERAGCAHATCDPGVALGLARASTRALMYLSPLAHRAITAAVAHEVAWLREQNGHGAEEIAQAVERVLQDAI